MFSGSFSIWHWLIVLVIVIAIFGTKKIRNAGGDLGNAVKNFKKAMHEGEEEAQAAKAEPEAIKTEAQAAAGQASKDAASTPGQASAEAHEKV